MEGGRQPRQTRDAERHDGSCNVNRMELKYVSYQERYHSRGLLRYTNKE